jgi:hypothetical protein
MHLARRPGLCCGFVKFEITNAAGFCSCDIEDAIRSFAALIKQDGLRVEVTAKHARANISHAIAADIVATANEV